jgi:trehalose 6-phosphate synthase/phosphatase
MLTLLCTLVFINDYHLLLVPEMLREMIPDAPIGLFLHAPFPSSEIFRCLTSKIIQKKR